MLIAFDNVFDVSSTGCEEFWETVLGFFYMELDFPFMDSFCLKSYINHIMSIF